jgi:hypothetical protein
MSRVKKIETSIIINAGVEEVWRAITDVASYNKWNPQIIDIKGRLEANETIYAEIYAPDGSGTKYGFEGRVVKAEPNKVLAWEGGTKGILFGYHYWILEPHEEGTKVLHGEDMEGSYIDGISDEEFDLLKPAYEDYNVKLKQYVEASL